MQIGLVEQGEQEDQGDDEKYKWYMIYQITGFDGNWYDSGTDSQNQDDVEDIGPKDISDGDVVGFFYYCSYGGDEFRQGSAKCRKGQTDDDIRDTEDPGDDLSVGDKQVRAGDGHDDSDGKEDDES